MLSLLHSMLHIHPSEAETDLRAFGSNRWRVPDKISNPWAHWKRFWLRRLLKNIGDSVELLGMKRRTFHRQNPFRQTSIDRILRYQRTIN